MKTRVKKRSLIFCIWSEKQILLEFVQLIHCQLLPWYQMTLDCKVALVTLNTSSAGPTYIQDSKLVIAVSADVLAPNGARSSADTVLTM